VLLPAAVVIEIRRLCGKVESKLRELEKALTEEPRTIDRARSEYLDMLARYVQQLTANLVAVLEKEPEAAPAKAPALLELAREAHALAERCARHTWDRRFAWATADGRQLRFHHLHELGQRLSSGPAKSAAAAQDAVSGPEERWLAAERAAEALADKTADWKRQLDAVLPASVWRDLEHGHGLSTEQDRLLRQLVSELPIPDPKNLAATLHPPLRKFLLAELGRRDPSLAFRVASHLWARDVGTLLGSGQELISAVESWQKAEEWVCFAVVREMGAEAWYIPAAAAQRILLLHGDQLAVAAVVGAGNGLEIEPVPTLGLRGAGICRLRLTDSFHHEATAAVAPDEVLRLWSVVSAADLISIAFGMTDLLCRRAVEQATSRVQFPGLFHDEKARDPIGKFGAIKKMVAEIAARRYLLETLDHDLSPRELGPDAAAYAALAKALAAEALGTAPGSVTYNAGQVFGGTAYSEDDLLSKYYRDAAAWRFLGPDNVQTFHNRGRNLLEIWPDGTDFSDLLAADPDLLTICAQRQALRIELDALQGMRIRLRDRVSEWVRDQPGTAAEQAEFHEALGRHDATLGAVSALLLRTQARLEAGYSSEIEIALLRVWLSGAAAAQSTPEGVVRRHLQPPLREDRPVVDPAVGPPVMLYKDLLAAPTAYNSGDFLLRPVDLIAPRYVPEMVETDPTLAQADRDIRTELEKHFGGTRDGLVYERYIERQHRPDAADLDFLRRQGFFRMPIPPALGGVGRSKAEYYLLTTNTHRLADVAVSLTIQVNSSLGTTPVLAARDKDLPKAKKDLEAFAGNTALHHEISHELTQLQTVLQERNAADARGAFRPLNQRLEETVFKSTAVRVLAHAFAQAWQQAAQASKEYNLPAMSVAVTAAVGHWQSTCERAGEMADEMGRRLRASDLFLRWVAAGQISAFALTEPSAGSDTARVATRARLRSVPVDALADGTYEFTPVGGKEPRRLLDADRLEFRDTGGGSPQAYYRWSEAEAAPIQFDEYDYENDARKQLYFLQGRRKVYFHDIAQLRPRNGRPWYDYWELTGAKMWITNGRMCGIMCLYAKADEGVTGFVVDRHAEGLVVGKDEEKMGQCGSPTNELSLQAVRVPRENVIGLEGRGQVNALETLNVGRAGIAMSAMCQMQRIIGFCRDFAADHAARIADGRLRLSVPESLLATPQAANPDTRSSSPPPWVGWRLARMEEERFIAEALAYDVIGKFEHKKTTSVRLESAVAKLVASELLHGLIERAEEIHGLAGQTQLHLIEKRKRDARVLNIYEGTNEIQRFFILRDLVGEVARRWSPASGPTGYLGREALELENLKGKLREVTEAAVQLLGAQVAQNPNLQANCFLLAEAVAWLGAADSTLGRLAWLGRREMADEEAAPSAEVELGRRAFLRCAVEARDRLLRFEEELPQLRRGFYAPAVRAAALLFDRAHEQVPIPLPASDIRRPLSVLVVLGTPAPGLANPVVVQGQLQEPYLTVRRADRSALETALRLRDAAVSVTIEVITAGPAFVAQHLREFLSLGVDRVRLLVTPDARPVAPDRTAAALVDLLRRQSAFDLILGGAGGADTEEGLLAPLVAEALNVPRAGTAEYLAVRATGTEVTVLLTGDQGHHARPLPAWVSVRATLELRRFTTDDYVTNLSRAVELIAWPEIVPVAPATVIPRQAPAPRAEAGPAAAEALLPLEASHLVLHTLGLDGKSSPGRPQGPVLATVPIQNVSKPFFADAAAGPYVLTVLAGDGQGNLRPTAAATVRGARFVAGLTEASLGILALVPRQESLQKKFVSELAGRTTAPVVLLPVDADHPDEIRCRLLAQCWSQLAPGARAVIGEPWAEPAFLALAAPALASQRVFARVLELDRRAGGLIIDTGRLGDKIRCEYALAPNDGEVWWLTLTEETVTGPIPDEEPGTPALVQRWQPPLERFYGREDICRLLADLKQETGLTRLTDAEFIIDVGFGVGNRDGFETVILPLEKALRELGVRGLMVGGSRKVTEELYLLPEDRQIGQSGVSVNPRLLLAIGISGAPQHLNYIGPRATIIAFNRDPDAPLVTLNRRQPQPRVFPVLGDLFETVPAFLDGLRQDQAPPLAGVPRHDVTTPQ
jgi:alkylation response protein AidB-like acyl-CoA dehydrogenase/electron transfer flavoprotein alpha subunit